jgi:tRNA threonylcarbamoyladenosine biosynthesis protein TsaB
MIVLIDTSTPTCRISFVDGAWRYDDEWLADRQLAKGLLGYLDTQLTSQDKTWTDIEGIGVYRGPGSFTGLRIGLTVANTIADAQAIAIVGATGGAWQSSVIERLIDGQNDQIVLPFYGSEAHITKPRK